MLRTPEPANGSGKTYVGKPTYLTKYLVKTQGMLGKTRALQITVAEIAEFRPKIMSQFFLEKD